MCGVACAVSCWQEKRKGFTPESRHRSGLVVLHLTVAQNQRIHKIECECKYSNMVNSESQE